MRQDASDIVRFRSKIKRIDGARFCSMGVEYVSYGQNLFYLSGMCFMETDFVPWM